MSFSSRTITSAEYDSVSSFFCMRSRRLFRSVLDVPCTSMARFFLSWLLSCLAFALTTNPYRSTTAITLALVFSLTSGWLFSTLDTVPTAHPHSLAMSFMVIILSQPPRLRP